MQFHKPHRATAKTDPEPLIAWRARRLRDRGFGEALAGAVAADLALDLHALLELVDRGCPPGLAARIVAPLDHEGPAA